MTHNYIQVTTRLGIVFKNRFLIISLGIVFIIMRFLHTMYYNKL